MNTLFGLFILSHSWFSVFAYLYSTDNSDKLIAYLSELFLMLVYHTSAFGERYFLLTCNIKYNKNDL